MILKKISYPPFVTIAALLILAACSFQTAYHIPRITTEQKKTIAERISAAVATVDTNLNLGIIAVSPETGEVIYERNADQR